VFDFAFPERDYFPAQPPKQPDLLLVSEPVSGKFCCPEIGIRFGNMSSIATTMHVPETAVNKHSYSFRAKDDIGPSRKIPLM